MRTSRLVAATTLIAVTAPTVLTITASPASAALAGSRASGTFGYAPPGACRFDARVSVRNAATDSELSVAQMTLYPYDPCSWDPTPSVKVKFKDQGHTGVSGGTHTGSVHVFRSMHDVCFGASSTGYFKRVAYSFNEDTWLWFDLNGDCPF